MGGSGATTLYSREDGATVLEAADGTTTVLQPQHTQGSAAHRLTLTVEGGDGVVGGEGVTAIVDNRAGTATFVEGAEVVRTVAVSYATPILHHVFLQAAPATTTMHHPHTTHATLLQTTHVPAAAIIQPTSTARRPPTLHTSTTPIILQPARATIKEENGGRVIGSGSATTTTTTCSSSGTTPICLGDAPTTVTSSSTSSTTTSPTSSSFSPAPSPPLSLSPPSSSPSSGLGLSSSSSSSCNSKADDELTSLSWLQDSNLLRGTALSPVKPSQGLGDMNGAEVVKAESPTSDYGDESSDALEPGELTLNDQPHTQPSRSQPIPYNPQVHIKAKPPYSFSCLIFMAIEDSNNKALPVKDIYAWILEHFPYFRKAPTGWKNSVRHNLSLNKCFRKVEKAPNLGKGSLWMVDPAYRPNLLQALSKTPFHPYSNLDRIYMVSTKAAFLNKPVLCSRQLGETLNSPSQGSTQRAAASPETVSVSSSKPAGANVPNPELFPYLARRLGSSSAGLDTLGSTGLGTSPSGVHSEDVDAAAAMLALKHGPRILTPTNLSYSRLREGRDTSVLYEENTSRKRKRKRKHTEIGDARMMVISSSPSEDHSYTSMDGEEEEYPTPSLPPPPPPPSQATPTTSLASHCHPSPSKKVHHSPTSSVDEAFSDDSYDSDVGSEASQAEMRQLVEGADALLNLAAVATSLASKHKLEGDSTSYSNHHYPDSANQNTHMKIASFRPQKLHILKSPKSSKVSHDKTKNTSEILTNNNTIVNNNNKILKVKRFGGSQIQGAVKHLPASR
ncbi:forkhead box protein N3 isoform X3 [Macrobrachium rosenbergii]|uniref:forkhead box protein N3 isoform X3 n=1 Tax=Macrobrachium rosenbergii TaxID=79674 RepID=UPI0034D601F8